MRNPGLEAGKVFWVRCKHGSAMEIVTLNSIS